MKFDSERGREMGRLGGAAKGRAYKAKRGLRRTLSELLAAEGSTVTDEDTSGLTAGELLARGLIRQAIEGNIKAAEFIRDTVGEKPGAKGADSSDKAAPPGEIRITVVE